MYRESKAMSYFIKDKDIKRLLKSFVRAEKAGNIALIYKDLSRR